LKAHAAFYGQVSQTVNFLLAAANRTRLGFVATHPLGEWLDKVLVPVFSTYISAYNAWKDISTRTAKNISDLEAAENALLPLYQTLRAILTAMPFVSDSDLHDMALPERSSGERKPAPVAKKFPEIIVATSLVRHLLFSFYLRDKENKLHKRKPRGQHGVELCWMVSDVPITSIDQLMHSSFTTTTDLDLGFSDGERGKHVYYAARWENSRGEKGPWSLIETALVP
jgi:hypothetical protein